MPTTATALLAYRSIARRYFDGRAPEAVLDAKARSYAWRPFAKHTAEELAEHRTDLATCDAYEATIVPVDVGADPMGDE